jgi:hypothetical protein
MWPVLAVDYGDSFATSVPLVPVLPNQWLSDSDGLGTNDWRIGSVKIPDASRECARRDNPGVVVAGSAAKLADGANKRRGWRVYRSGCSASGRENRQPVAFGFTIAMPV